MSDIFIPDDRSYEELLEHFSDGHPKNPRGKYWESNPDRLYRAIMKRLRRQQRNLVLVRGGAYGA